MTTYTIYPIVLGTKVFDKSMMTYQHGAGESYTIPIYGWYIKGGDKNILVDTGEMSPIQSKEREKAIGGKIYRFEEGLAQFGLTPESIDIIIHTHLHNDHCENDYKCINAAIYVHEKELKRIHDPHPLDFRYLEDYIEDVEENGQIKVMTGDTEVVPGIACIHTPVHTDGGMSIAIDTDKGKAVITGFCVIKENFHPPKEIRAMEMEVIPPGTLVNAFDAYDIMLKIRDMADILIPLHEPEFAGGECIPPSSP
ncbi:Glyoxylase, beta-lactamase superfamily II [Desulfocicer vacuolatum DSM 3385]|uniref:Glyoxylase, beta-lactamase superfamily II n=1 Tax=Desulfocicer vacuolatum DSM 3385 TaxID=1121400 RepID=A0A1W2AJR4_9BACT|nr:N-acyl homoserine lactonase family protein [Desulfocicer vacuolatum]SMC60979.1 Glyoxylase, beta-lactamase superfamily II [Desulfocicer vacuolatum DSM 3385]